MRFVFLLLFCLSSHISDIKVCDLLFAQGQGRQEKLLFLRTAYASSIPFAGF